MWNINCLIGAIDITVELVGYWPTVSGLVSTDYLTISDYV